MEEDDEDDDGTSPHGVTFKENLEDEYVPMNR